MGEREDSMEFGHGLGFFFERESREIAIERERIDSNRMRWRPRAASRVFLSMFWCGGVYIYRATFPPITC